MPGVRPTIAASALAGNLESATVLDCRFSLGDPLAGRRAYEVGHIPGAIYADLERDLSDPVTGKSGRHPMPRADEARDRFAGLGVSDETPVVCYDDAGGAFAARAWWMLRWLGHPDARLLDGGLQAWVREDGLLERNSVEPVPGRFHGNAPDSSWLASTEEVESARAGLLIDARSEERYGGLSEPIDTVAGHIPGALNFPFSRSLDEQGCFQAATRLRSLWQPFVDQSDDQRMSVMCGSGVTACHLAASAVLAGLPMPRLYAGSWSEWIRDPARPVEGAAT